MAQAVETPETTADSISTALATTQPRFDRAEALSGHPAETEGEEEPEAEPTPPPAPATEPPRHKYATLEEYDRAYSEAERRMHAATEETRLAREETAALKAKGPEPSPAPSPPLPKTAALSQVMREIAELDADAPDYHQQVAEKWVAALDPLIEERSRQSIKDEARRIAQELIAEERKTWRADQQRMTEEDRLHAVAVEQAREAGLDLEHSVRDNRLFWQVIAPEVDEALPNATYEEKIREAVKRVPEFRQPSSNGGTPPAAPIPPAETVERRRATVRPMGRQSAGPAGPGEAVEPPPEAPTPLSITAALAESKRGQRV